MDDETVCPHVCSHHIRRLIRRMLDRSTGLLAPSVAVPYSPSTRSSNSAIRKPPSGLIAIASWWGGNPASPRAHLEKIATIRAAEIGMEQRLRYFKVESMALSETCSPATEGNHKSGKTNEVRTKYLTAEVAYAKAPADATYLESKKTFEDLRPTLDTEPVIPETPPVPQTPCT